MHKIKHTNINYIQLQNALHAFDFLQNIPYDQDSFVPQPQVSLDVDLLRPVLSMPPVILMGDSKSGSGNSSPRLNIHSIPPSPIVEMPPSPAPSQLPIVEFPAEEDVYEYDEHGELVEVCHPFHVVAFNL
jgi:hypothetical protein